MILELLGGMLMGGGLVALPLALKLGGEKKGRAIAEGERTAAQLEVLRVKRELYDSEGARRDSDNRLESVIEKYRHEIASLEAAIEENDSPDALRERFRRMFAEADRIRTVGRPHN
jgi:hypothetical protein